MSDFYDPNKPPQYDIEVTEGWMNWGANGRPLYFPCLWCRLPAMKLVTRTSRLSGERMTDHACDRCAAPWEEAQRKGV